MPEINIAVVIKLKFIVSVLKQKCLIKENLKFVETMSSKHLIEQT